VQYLKNGTNLDKPITMTTLANLHSFHKSLNSTTKGGHFEIGQAGSIKCGLSSLVIDAWKIFFDFLLNRLYLFEPLLNLLF